MDTNSQIFFIYLLSFFLVMPCLSYAEQNEPSSSALHGLEFIAPKERFVIRIEQRENSYDTVFDQNSNKQALGSELDNLTLDSNILPSLAAFGASASLGTTQFDADVKTQRTELTLGYGINDDLTIGVIIPYGKVTTHATFSVTGGNVGFNPAFDNNQPVSVTNSPLLPVGSGASSPAGTQGVQSIINNPAFGFAYEPLNTTRWEGFGDPTLGILWRTHKSDHDSLIVGGGIRFGIADDVDPDNLLQVPIDDGTTDLRARAEYYRDLSNGFDLKLAAEYTYQSKDKVTRRIPTAGAFLAAESSKEKVDRKLGNYREYDIGIGKVLNDWRFSATWHRYIKSSDAYKSSINTDTSSLENETGLFADQWRATVSWSGIKAWQQGDIPLPLVVQFEIQKTVDAKNFPEVTDVYLQLTSFF